MGRLHARTVAACPEARLVAVHDVHPERAAVLAREFDCAVGLEEAELYIVATPASAHLEVALPLLERSWVLIEKPPALAWDPRLGHPRALAAWSERFHRGWVGTRVRQHFRAVRERVSRALDVDPIADLLVHDLDLLLHHTRGVELVEVSGTVRSLRAQFRFDGGQAAITCDGDRNGAVEHEIDGVPIDRSFVGADPLTRQLRCVLDHLRTGRGPLQAGRCRAVLDLAADVREQVCASGS